MSRLKTIQRKNLPQSSFALHGVRGKSGMNMAGKGAYPIPDISHARDALSRVSANGTPTQKKEVARAVARKYPALAARSAFIKKELHG